MTTENAENPDEVKNIPSNEDKIGVEVADNFEEIVVPALPNDAADQRDEINLNLLNTAEIAPILKFNREELVALFDRGSYTPESLIGLLERDYADNYAEPCGVVQGYSLKEHTLMVLSQFETYFGYRKLPGNIDPLLFRLILALHDFGKPEAVKNEGKQLQHAYTIDHIKPIFRALKYDKTDIALAIALIKEDPIGEFLTSRIDLEKAVAILDKSAKETGMDLKDFFELLLIFFQSDSSSYTLDAGSKQKSHIDGVYRFDRRHRRLRFAPAANEKIQALRNAVITRNHANKIHSISSIEEFIAEHEDNLAKSVDDLKKLPLEQQLVKFEKLFTEDEDFAVAMAWILYEKNDFVYLDPDVGASFPNLEKYRLKPELVCQTLDLMKKICTKANIDLQFGLMALVFVNNPALYAAAMEQLTYSLPAEKSAEHADQKIDQLVLDFPPELKNVIIRLAARLENEVIPKMMDTHATDLCGAMKIFEAGSLNSAKQIGVNLNERKDDDFKLLGSLSVFTYMGSFFSAHDFFITIDKDFVEETHAGDGDDYSYYLSEDYVLRPRRTVNEVTAAQRMSFDEKLRDVMKRADMKRYLAYKMATFICEEARNEGLSIEHMNNVDLSSWALRYFNAHRSANDAPTDKLAGRPEGHLKFPVPVDKIKLQMPGYTVKGFLTVLERNQNEAIAANDKDIIYRVNSLIGYFSELLDIEPPDKVATLLAKLPADWQNKTIPDLFKAHLERIVATNPAISNSALARFLESYSERVTTYDPETNLAPIKMYYRLLFNESLHPIARNLDQYHCSIIILPEGSLLRIADLVEAELFGFYLETVNGLDCANAVITEDGLFIKEEAGVRDLYKMFIKFKDLSDNETKALRKKFKQTKLERKSASTPLPPEMYQLRDSVSPQTLQAISEKLPLLREKRKANPHAFNAIVNGLLRKTLGLSDDIVEKIIKIL